MAALQREAASGDHAESEASAASAEAQKLRAKVQRYKLECKLLTVLLKVSLAVTSDVFSGAHAHPLCIHANVFLDSITMVL